MPLLDVDPQDSVMVTYEFKAGAVKGSLEHSTKFGICLVFDRTEEKIRESMRIP